jgi:predicted AlkP superfamily phosphohydrolase/phosphomutase
MTARVLFIGLDAAEAPLLTRWADEGHLPNLGALRARGTTAALANCMDTLPGAIWPELITGIHGARSSLYFHPRQLHTGEGTLRRLTEPECRPEDQFWAVAARAGRRTCVVDLPQTPALPEIDAVQILEYGLHDRQFTTRSIPPEELEGVRARFGDHPVDSCDDHDHTEAGYLALLDGLERGVAAKNTWAPELLARERWDLFACCWSETHCVGHQFRHLADPRDPAHDPDAHPRLRDSWRTVYAAVDAGIGRLVDAAGPDASVVVVASHGMGPYIAGYQLLAPFLERMGLGPQASPAAAAPGRLPSPVRSVLRVVVPSRLRRRRLVATGRIRTWSWLESPTCKVAPLENNRVGALRLNLRGREPRGPVEPGAEAEALLDELCAELRALCLPDTDTPVVADVVRPHELLADGEVHPDLPDLLVTFRRDLGPLDACWSERVGLIESPIAELSLPRSGDHTAASHLWAAGPGIEAGTTLAPADVLDITPTLLSLLEVPLPEGLDGTPIDLGTGSRSPLAQWRVVGGRELAARAPATSVPPNG